MEAIENQARSSQLPRLAVALLLRGMQPATVESFAAYHIRIGFERVIFFFDAPEDPLEEAAIAAALALAAEAEGMDRVQVHLCNARWWEEERHLSRFYQRRHQGGCWSEVVKLHEEVRDVQSRQSLVLERAVRDCHSQGIDWLLHCDSDECLLVPGYRDARLYFATVPDLYDEVVFHNLEAVPESMDVQDWYREVNLFKVHMQLLHDQQAKVPSSTGRSAAPRMPSDPKDRRRWERNERWIRRLMAKGKYAFSAPCPAVLELVAAPIAGKRRLSYLQCGLANQLPEWPDSDMPSASSSESDKEKSHRKRAEERNKELRWLDDVPSYFNAYENGKSACRLRRGRSPPCPVGVHRFLSDRGGPLSSLQVEEPGCPVILHYVHCGYAAWRRKYDILCKGHFTEDGAFRPDRGNLRAHLAHRVLSMRGDAAQLESYYRTFIMGNQFDELPYLASLGCLVRIDAVREVLDSGGDRDVEAAATQDAEVLRPFSVLRLEALAASRGQGGVEADTQEQAAASTRESSSREERSLSTCAGAEAVRKASTLLRRRRSAFCSFAVAEAAKAAACS